MPVRGTKPSTQRRRTNAPTHAWTEVVDVPFTAGPALPAKPDLEPWSAMLLDWWGDLSSMPHCTLWSASDWRFAIDTALVAEAFFAGHRPSGAELRARQRVMGMTADARRDLRIKYVPHGYGGDEAEEVSRLDDYRDL